jgi:hypothetical protein
MSAETCVPSPAAPIANIAGIVTSSGRVASVDVSPVSAELTLVPLIDRCASAIAACAASLSARARSPVTAPSAAPTALRSAGLPITPCVVVP